MNQESYNSFGAAVIRWWSSNIQANTGAARKTRAQLRRASRPSEILAMEATHRLHAKIRDLDLNVDYKNELYPMRLALITTVIAGINEHVKTNIPEGLGRPSGDKRAISEIRFQRIISAKDDWELANRIRRSLPVLNRQANVSSAGADMFFWGERTRNRWCFQYFDSNYPQVLDIELSTDDTENI